MVRLIGAGLVIILALAVANYLLYGKDKKKASQEPKSDATPGNQPEPPAPEPNETEQIFELKKLLDAGAITQEEFEQKKSELLDQI
ncbi:MAG: hypothetical protein CMH54_02620 [Myxococcales bacterium]|nr:hypothetical protein [Myxococcales bacterium]|tara:strand:- start:183 stop:440 length:258 start_codon:yes stop_codon:yes gene_type:complete